MHYLCLLHCISECCELSLRNISLIQSLLPILTSASLAQLFVISSSGYCHRLLTGQSSCLYSPLFPSPFHTTAARVFQNYKFDHFILYSDLYNRFPLPLTSMAWEGLHYLKPVFPSPLVGVCVLPPPCHTLQSSLQNHLCLLPGILLFHTHLLVHSASSIDLFFFLSP